MITAFARVAADPEGSEPTGVTDARRRRLLMFVPDYPTVNPPAALGALGFARYLAEFGWDASVVSVRTGVHSHRSPT